MPELSIQSVLVHITIVQLWYDLLHVINNSSAWQNWSRKLQDDTSIFLKPVPSAGMQCRRVAFASGFWCWRNAFIHRVLFTSFYYLCIYFFFFCERKDRRQLFSLMWNILLEKYRLRSLILLIGGALRPRLYGKLFWSVHSPDGHVRNPEAGLNIILYSDWL